MHDVFENDHVPPPLCNVNCVIKFLIFIKSYQLLKLIECRLKMAENTFLIKMSMTTKKLF